MTRMRMATGWWKVSTTELNLVNFEFKDILCHSVICEIQLKTPI
jgi:hypothetical protein